MILNVRFKFVNSTPLPILVYYILLETLTTKFRGCQFSLCFHLIKLIRTTDYEIIQCTVNHPSDVWGRYMYFARRGTSPSGHSAIRDHCTANAPTFIDRRFTIHLQTSNEWRRYRNDGASLTLILIGKEHCMCFAKASEFEFHSSVIRLFEPDRKSGSAKHSKFLKWVQTEFNCL